MDPCNLHDTLSSLASHSWSKFFWLLVPLGEFVSETMNFMTIPEVGPTGEPRLKMMGAEVKVTYPWTV